MSQVTSPTIVQKQDRRQSSPDSEALISSDDEGDRPEPQRYKQPKNKLALSVNRPNETSNISQPRKASFGSNSLSPTASHSGTLASDVGIWAHQTQGSNSIGRSHAGSSSFPWGVRIWNNDARKESSTRLTEVVCSPTTRRSPLSPNNRIYSETNPKDQIANPTIPFPIPLHPTPKSYRSQSYSVGQLDPDSPASISSHVNQGSGVRGRNFNHSGFQHRPSRPSMLSEMSNESLGKVKEVDDYAYNSRKNNRLYETSSIQSHSKSHEKLSLERASLQQPQFTPRLRPGSSTSSMFPQSLRGVITDELDSAIDEIDDVNENQPDSSLREFHGRRLSELSVANNNRMAPYGQIENRKLENMKKAFWQSSLGFGGLSDIPQSRRHSFADIPSRNIVMGSNIEPFNLQENSFKESKSSEEYSSKFQEQKEYPFDEQTAFYYDGVSTLSRNPGTYNNMSYQKSGRSCAMQPKYSGAQLDLPHNKMYSGNQSRQIQPLTIVLFKSSRCDVFYIQEGNELSVKPGDMVIVEADRGTDLGTVACTNIDWSTAKELKDYYAEEHYKWLSSCSRNYHRSSVGNGPSLTAKNGSCQAGATGGINHSNQHISQELSSCDLKPKLIKRLAQKHESDALREKEGSEAKAKRVCMQKVKEHGLKMDILDAEFQMDWKKLTFYYFADSYINFNSLVTDLFKIYKTRIWMSAINPASFALPSLGPQIPVSLTRNERHSPTTQQFKSSCALQASRELQTPYSLQPTPPLDRSFNSFLSPPYVLGFSPYLNTNPRHANASSNRIVTMDPLVGYMSHPDFRKQTTQFGQNISLPTPKNSEFSQGAVFGPNDAFMKNFLGLSMNSH